MLFCATADAGRGKAELRVRCYNCVIRMLEHVRANDGGDAAFMPLLQSVLRHNDQLFHDTLSTWMMNGGPDLVRYPRLPLALLARFSNVTGGSDLFRYLLCWYCGWGLITAASSSGSL